MKREEAIEYRNTRMDYINITNNIVLGNIVIFKWFYIYACTYSDYTIKKTKPPVSSESMVVVNSVLETI